MIFLQQILSAAADSASQAAEKVSGLQKWAEQFSGLPADQIIEKLVSEAVDLVLKLIVAIIVFYIGKLIINRIHKSIRSILLKRQVDKSLTTFILSVLKITLLFILVVIVISILGIETSSFIALFASAGVAIGMALSGTLQNFAGGVLILLQKPYKVGDYIEVQGYAGTVKAIQIFNTILNTVDNKSIFIPNGGLSTGSLKNYSNEDYRRVDWTVNISYGDDYDAAKNAILKIIDSDDRIVKRYVEDDREMRMALKKQADVEDNTVDMADDDAEGTSSKRSKFRRIFRHKENVVTKLQALSSNDNEPVVLQKADRSPFVALGSLSASSVDIVVRVWTPAAYYWDVFFDINERIYKELPQAGINFPFPQMDVHISK